MTQERAGKDCNNGKHERDIEAEDVEVETIDFESSSKRRRIEKVSNKYEEFIPPSLPGSHEDLHDTFTYISSVPRRIKEFGSEPCILGVDEAGRGPVLGPMVYAVSYCRRDFKKTLEESEFNDSKVLDHNSRSRLLKYICHEQSENIGWGTTTMSARDITSGMLRPRNFGVHNLNEQAHDTTIELIQKILDIGVNVQEIYVDTVGPPDKYEKKLSDRFPGIQVTVTKKADSLFKIVSAASICAKVTRDAALKLLDDTPDDVSWGSGYPGDPKTVAWLHNNIDPLFGWDKSVRFSWNTAKDLIEKGENVKVEWGDDVTNKSSFFTPNICEDSMSCLTNSIRWFASSVTDTNFT